MHGIFVASGSAIAQGVTLQGARLVNVTPTALHLLGLGVPDEMDGRVLVEALRSDWSASHPIQTTVEGPRTQLPELAEVYSQEEAAKVEDALRALGYLD
jgi:hypothetical protein